ncbi:DEAD/DEAH box helicase [Ramlibacter sp.]|uniref:DEAD/DEAH box helicase n=1 Tax=Ramlibacter sp. TaxID=1917967 RepID=UPI002CD158C1|nr:ATP-binding domain-containing protein [Ramlibacter sp.]HWI84457.1 ATP-binding domain-containing protein [Ramlibacter sp.]
MLDIVYGKKTNPQAVESLVAAIKQQDWDGSLYVGYPVFGGDDASASITDALLVCREHGLVIFDMALEALELASTGEVEAAVRQRHKELRRKVNARLVAYEELIDDDTMALAFKVEVITLAPAEYKDEGVAGVISADNLVAFLSELPPLKQRYIPPLNAAIQKTAALRPKKKRLGVRKSNSMGANIKYLEGQIANLDRWQRNAAIESPEGPQRIRGLAGSGKTIILAMKAAYLHANDPEAEIVVTFNTRSLYQQFKGLIRRFYFEHMSDEPDWDRLHILHAWGSPSEAGFYSVAATDNGYSPTPFGTARYKYGYSAAFSGVCAELCSSKIALKQRWDYVLIDEAQDFPESFFRLVYLVTKNPHRIVWAYDELQNLGDSSMPPIDELFGKDVDGQPLVQINNVEGQPKQDILLPICYRNPSWLLTLALGVGLGTKRANGTPVQMFPDPDFWREIGYEATAGKLELGKSVSLQRRPDRSAPFFEDVLSPESSVRSKRFESATEQAEWIAKDIQRILNNEELDHSDILVVIPNSLDAPKIAQTISTELAEFGIRSHLIGVTSSRDAVFIEGSIAMSGIYRAKGNEAPLVYVAHAEYGFDGYDVARRRNVLFTAMTRAKAWVRVCGVGTTMDGLINEIRGIASDNYQLCFTYPTSPENSEDACRLQRTN